MKEPSRTKRDFGPVNWETIRVLGIKIDLVDYEKAVNIVLECILKGQVGKFICVTPVHPIMESQKDPALKEALENAFLTVPDGMPVVWAARLLGAEIRDRVYGPDLMLRTCQMAAELGYSIYLYGSQPEVLDKLEAKLLQGYSRLNIVGRYSPPFRELTAEEEDDIVKMIESKSPAILFVGLGAPRQEKWMARNSGKINVPVTIGVGAAFDFLSGNKKQAPHWMQRRGLEWLFRMLNEPKRLWNRYLLYNPLFISMLVTQLWRTRHLSVLR